MARKQQRQYRTLDIAKLVGVHPNTVRLYEKWGFLHAIPRGPNGYRLYGEVHLDQMRLARCALHAPYPGGKLPVLELVHSSIKGDYSTALEFAYIYLEQIHDEQDRAEQAVKLVERWARSISASPGTKRLSIRQAADTLMVTPDQLRNWERNGLIRVPRHPSSGYREFSEKELRRLRVIRTLCRAGYSMMAILRMLNQLDRGSSSNIRQALDTPREDEDICYVTDRWLSTLAEQELRARDTIDLLQDMFDKYG